MNRTAWHEHEWQLIHAGAQSPSMHMALDEVLTTEVASGRRKPTLRVWEWASPAVVIGRHQSLRNEVDSDAARRHGIEVVRCSSNPAIPSPIRFARRCRWWRACRSRSPTS